jgi:hypothetical protein
VKAKAIQMEADPVKETERRLMAATLGLTHQLNFGGSERRNRYTPHKKEIPEERRLRSLRYENSVPPPEYKYIPWSPEEIIFFVEERKKRTTFREIAVALKRTLGSVRGFSYEFRHIDRHPHLTIRKVLFRGVVGGDRNSVIYRPYAWMPGRDIEMKERRKESIRRYRNKPETKEKYKAYNMRPEVKQRLKERRSSPEARQRHKESVLKFYEKPENKQYKKEYDREWGRGYWAIPKNRLRRRKNDRLRRHHQKELRLAAVTA